MSFILVLVENTRKFNEIFYTNRLDVSISEFEALSEVEIDQN